MPLVETQAGRRLQRQGRRGHDHRADRARGRHGLCLRAGHAARRPQLREPHDLGRLHDRPGRQDLCRAHRNPRQRRTRDYVIRREFDVSEGDAFNQVLIQRAKRRLETLDFFETRRDFDGAGLASPTRSFSSSTWSTSRPANSRSAPAIRRAAKRRARRSKARSPSATSSAAASSSASRPAAARTRATSRSPSPSPISSAAASRPASTSSASTRHVRRLRERDHRRARSASACRSPRTCRRSSPTTYRRKNTNSTTIATTTGVTRSDPNCDISHGDHRGRRGQPLDQVVGVGALVYNTIDDMKNPHAGIFANITTEVAGLGGDAQVRQADGARLATTTRCRRR